MKKFLTLATIMIMAFGMNAQMIGANAEGLTEKYQQSDLTLIDQLGDIVIAWPGGASAKYNESRLDRPGIGMQRTTINYFNSVFGKDENGVENLESDLRDLSQDSTDDRSQLYDLQEIQESSGCKIIWKANIFVSPDVVVKSIEDFQSIGGVISGFSLGNELYFVLDFDGEQYIDMIDGIARRLKAEYPLIPIALNYGQDVRSKQHQMFNAAVVNYRNANPDIIAAVDTHPYASASLLNDAKILHPANGTSGEKKDVNPIAYQTEFNAALSNAFDKYNDILSTTDYYDACFDTIKKQMPGVKIWTTEFGSIPVLLWGNTWSNASYLFRTYTTYYDDVEYFCAHNLLGNFFWAFIYDHQIHTMYYALQLSNELIQHEFVDLQEVNQINTAGEHYFRFNNFSGDESDFFFELDPDLEFVSSVKHALHSEKNYGSIGPTGFYLKKNAPIPGTDVFFSVDGSFRLNAYDFGYVCVTTKQKFVPVHGSLDTSCLNYNAMANVIDSCQMKIYGSLDPNCMNYNANANVIQECIPFPDPCVYGCTNPDACNYNKLATCDDESCILKKKFLFFKYCPKRSSQSKRISHG